MATSEIVLRKLPDTVTSWDKAKIIFHEKVKDEDGDLIKVQEFLSDSTTVQQALGTCEAVRKKADNEYSTGYVTVAGKELFLRKRLSRILKKVQMFVQFGDIAIQHNPDTTSLVWAAFRMMLQLAINDIETCELLTDACEEIAGTLFVCEVYERRYRVVIDSDNSEIALKVVEQIPPLYAVILELSYAAKKFLDKQKIARFLRSNTGLKFKSLVSTIKKKVQDIHTTAGIAFQEEALTSLAGLHKEFREEFDEMRQFLRDSVFSVAEETNRNVQEINIGLKRQSKLDEQKKLKEEYEKNVKWLEPLEHLEDPSSEYRLNLDRRQPDTCNWIFNRAEYKAWYQSTSSSMLWISGNAGFGKSVLISTIIERLKAEHVSDIVLFFFCKTGDDSTQRAGSVLRNLIFQLYEKTRESLPESQAQCTKIITKAQNTKTKSGEMTEYVKSVKNLKLIMEEIIEALGKQIFVIVDAVDECKDRKSEALVAAFRGLVDENPGIKIILASRPENDLSESLEGISRVEVNQENNSADIKIYLVKELKKVSSLTIKDRKIACKAIIERSDGMFRYANMQVDRLRLPWRPPLKNHLNSLPVGIEASYRQIFEQIKPELQELLIVALRWAVLADGDVPAPLVAEDYRRVFELDEDPEDDENDEYGDGEDGEDDIGAENGADGQLRSKSHDEMLKDTLMQIREAGSVFLESGGNEKTISLRHTSVKDFVLREGERADLRIDSQQVLCQRCKAAHSHTSALAITPKSGHLTILLSIFNHINSPVFIEQYVPAPPVTEKNDSEEPKNSEETTTDATENHNEETGGEPAPNEKKVESENQETPEDLDHGGNTEAEASQSHNDTKDEAKDEIGNKEDSTQSASDESIQVKSENETSKGDSLGESLIQSDTVATIDGGATNETAEVQEDLETRQPQTDEPTPQDGQKDVDTLSEADSDYETVTGQQDTDVNTQEKKPRYELAHWMYHLKEAENLWSQEERETSEDWTRLWELVERFLFDSPDVFIRWQYAVWELDYPYTFDEDSVSGPLHVAASYGLTALAERLLLKRGVEVDAANKDGITPLHLGATTQEPKMVALLIKHGADVNKKDRFGSTPLCRVTFKLNGNAEIVKLLLGSGAEVDHRMGGGMTPLHYACLNGNFEAFKLLIAHGADVKAKDNIGETCMHHAVPRADPPPDLIKKLIRLGADVNEQNNNSQAPLAVAAVAGSKTICNILLDAGADIDDDDIWGYTALHGAAANGDLEMVKLLTERGANVNYRDKKGKTALSWAAQCGRAEVVRYLIQKTGTQEIDIRGRTALHRAAAKGHVEIVAMLLEAGDAKAALRAQDNALRATPLHAAAYQGHEKIVDMFLQNGSDVLAVNRSGETPFDLALKRWGTMSESFEGNAHCLVCILKNREGISVSHRRLLHITIQKGNESLVRELLEVGAPPNEVDEHGWTPLLVALHCGRAEIVDILKAHEAIPIDFPSNTSSAGKEPVGGYPPTLLTDTHTKSDAVIISEDGMELRYCGTNDYYSIGVANANHPIPAGRYIFYYEIEITDDRSEQDTDLGVVTFGIAKEKCTVHGRFPGWDPGSYGYHGDDGQYFSGEGQGTAYGETYGYGDTVGCGVDFGRNTIFFTKNGKTQGALAGGFRGVYYPLIALRHKSVVRVNFGQKPFVYTPGDSLEAIKPLEDGKPLGDDKPLEASGET